MAYDGAGHRISMTLLRKICDGAGSVKAAYDYRATVVAMRTKQQVAKCCPPFGEQVDLTVPAEKVTENFTGIRLRGECCEHACMFIAEPMGLGAMRKEKDDETELNYFGARYLDSMLGLWVSVDAARQYQNPYLYAGNNPVMRTDPDGNQDGLQDYIRSMVWNNTVIPQFEKAADISAKTVAAGAISGPGPSQGKEAVGAVVRVIYDAATENQVPVDEKLLFNDGVAPSDKTGVTIPFDYEEGLNE